MEEIHSRHSRRSEEAEDCYSHMELLVARDDCTWAEGHNSEAEEGRSPEEDIVEVTATEDMGLAGSLEEGMVVESVMEGNRNLRRCAVEHRSRPGRGNRTFRD